MHEHLTPISEADDNALHKDADAPTVSAKRRAAVLIPLVLQDNEWHILFIRRAHNERDRHSGQVAFPGGRIEDNDANAKNAALRETYEEIGVPEQRISVIGELNPYVTISLYEVTPIVGIVQWPTHLRLQSTEVARAFLIPMGWLRERSNFTFRARQGMDPTSARRHPIVVYEPFDNEILWGATARMTLNFFKSVDEGTILLPKKNE